MRDFVIEVFSWIQDFLGVNILAHSPEFPLIIFLLTVLSCWFFWKILYSKEVGVKSLFSMSLYFVLAAVVNMTAHVLYLGG